MSDEKNEKKKHPLLKAAAAGAAGAAAAYGGLSWYLFRVIFDLQHPFIKTAEGDDSLKEEETDWLVQSARSDAYIQSFDGLTLHAMLIRNHLNSHKWVLFAHDYRKSAMSMLAYIKEADARGYNVLAMDQRGCGASRGRYTGLGWLEHYDLISWTGYLAELDPQCTIVLFGVGLGGNAVMNAAGDYLSKHVVAAVEDSGWGDLREEVLYVLKTHPDFPSASFIVGMDFFVKHYLGFSLYSISTRRQLLTSRLPILFIHGSLDEWVPASMAFACCETCSSPKEIEIFEDSGHGKAYQQSGYFDRVFTFIEKVLA